MHIVFLVILGLLSIWSYTLIDLNLTLLDWSPYLAVQQRFIELGYFNRQLNGSIILILILLVMGHYFFLVHKKWQWTQLRTYMVIVGCVLSVGYTAFSHDLFNYIFDARIITKYGMNPYLHKALDFPNDDWIRFMQWTHRTYPYGPVWLIITVIPSFIGAGKFIITYLAFKLTFLMSYLFGGYFIYRIMQKLSDNTTIQNTGVALYAFNPLILIDGLLSPHLDIVMAVLGLSGIYAVLIRKQALGGVAILLSAGVKFATLPWILFSNQWFVHKFGNKTFAYILCGTSFMLGIVQAISQTNYQPWYGLLAAVTLPILTPYIKVKYLLIAGILLSLPMWIYIHHAFTGGWASALPIF